MKKSFFLITMIMVVLLALSACGAQQEAASSSTTHPLDAVEIPDSGYETAFAPLESATLYVNGTQQEIALDDPRLIHVINFLGYSIDTHQCGYLQGKIDADEIAQHYASEITMLEITFAVEPSNRDSGLRYASKILIGGDSFVYFASDSTSASVRWPYAKLRPEDTHRSDAGEPWEEGYWLDILEYCGF